MLIIWVHKYVFPRWYPVTKRLDELRLYNRKASSMMIFLRAESIVSTKIVVVDIELLFKAKTKRRNYSNMLIFVYCK